MYIDDDKARELMIEILDIEDDSEGIKELDEWIERSSVEKVFEKNMEILIGLIMDENKSNQVKREMRYANKK